VTPAVHADPPLPESEVRERRLYREEIPIWRRALAFPDDALHVAFWPVKQTIVWAERVRLPNRIEAGVRAPFRLLSPGDDAK